MIPLKYHFLTVQKAEISEVEAGERKQESLIPKVQKILCKSMLKKLEQEMSRFLLVLDKVFTGAEQQTQVKSVVFYTYF